MTYPDAGLFKEVTSENAVVALRQAIKEFGTCNHTVRQRIVLCRQGRSQEPTGTWTPTLFENDLLNLGIELINSRPYHSQTNGNLERFHRSVEKEIDHYESLPEYIKYYNKRRLYF